MLPPVQLKDYGNALVRPVFQQFFRQQRVGAEKFHVFRHHVSGHGVGVGIVVKSQGADFIQVHGIGVEDLNRVSGVFAGIGAVVDRGQPAAVQGIHPAVDLHGRRSFFHGMEKGQGVFFQQRVDLFFSGIVAQTGDPGILHRDAVLPLGMPGQNFIGSRSGLPAFGFFGRCRFGLGSGGLFCRGLGGHGLPERLRGSGVNGTDVQFVVSLAFAAVQDADGSRGQKQNRDGTFHRHSPLQHVSFIIHEEKGF